MKQRTQANFGNSLLQLIYSVVGRC